MVIRESKFCQLTFPSQWEEIEIYTTIYGYYDSAKKIKYYFRGVRLNKNGGNRL